MSHELTVLAFARSTSGFYFGELLAGLNREIAAAGGRVVIVQTLDPLDTADVVVQMPSFDLPLGWDEVDGAVAVSLSANAPYLTSLQEAGKPVVLSHWVDGVTAPIALPNNAAAVHAAIDHLVEHGHQRIGFVGSLVQNDMRERYEAYREALVRHGLPDEPALFFETYDSAERGGREVADRLATAAERPTAVLVATDRGALGLLDGLGDAGVRVPEDLAVVGYDNIEAGAFSTPSLTSVSQRFDEVGALAGRLVLAAIRGEDVPPTPHRPGPVTLTPRASCGCASLLLGDDSAVRPSAKSRSELRAEILEVLQATLVAGLDDVGSAEDVRLAIAEVEELLGEDRAGLSDDAPADDVEDGESTLRSLLTVLHRRVPRPDTVQHVANLVTEYLQRTDDPSVDPRTADGRAVSTAVWQLQAGAFLSRSQMQERLLTEQFRIAAGLLGTQGDDPGGLEWLAGTHVRAGALALWDGDPADGRLCISGVYDAAGAMGDAQDLVGTTVQVTAFPPHELVALARPSHREACFVVPVRTPEHYWGLLAVVGDIDTTSSRDTYHHWAQLLSSAFAAQELQRAVRSSEARYAYAAQAANDGLWEMEAGADSMYVSARCRDIAGLSRTVRGDSCSLAEWEDAVHPDDRAALRQALEHAVATPGEPVEIEYRVRCEDGSHRWVLARGLSVPGDVGEADRIVGSLSDIDQRKQLEEQLRQGALYDTVTGLPNRRLFLERLHWAVEQNQRDAETTYAVLFIDLDGFKLVNDSLGHLQGDELLRVVGDRLRAVVRSVDTAARFGGDEFAILLFDPLPGTVPLVARRIQQRIAAPIRLGGHEVAVTGSVGITTSDAGYVSAEDVLRDADTAMYHAKTAERGTMATFDPDMHARASARLRVRSELRTALSEGQFVVHYQPVVALDGAPLAHLEALVRWEHPERGLLLPGDFLPAMIDNAGIVTLGTWILDEVCRQVAHWRAELPADVAADLSVAVNISHREFWSEQLVPTLRETLQRHGLPPASLVLEITESVVMADPDEAREIMNALRALGLRLHIDDFGTGQSSLHALRSFPVDALKIDGSFVQEMESAEQNAELVRVIIAMGRTLGLDVVAECVETADQAGRLEGMGCSNAQGYLYARPMPADDVRDLLGRPLASDAGMDRVGAPEAGS